MAEKRYAIVRVDGFCPLKLERKLNCDNRLCEDCKLIKNYGDTREQFINKIQTAFKIAIRKHKEGKFVKGKSNNRQCAEIVAEYLGVEE